MAKTVSVILRRKIEHLGDLGDVVDVKAGYARNYLLPQRLAYVATDGNRRRLEQERAVAVQAEAHERANAQSVATAVEGTSITFSMHAGEEGKLYGSVGPRDIAARLVEEGYDIGGRHIALREPIKALGVYSVPVKLHPDVETSVKVWVIKEQEE